jgi:hypothetical protein
MAEEMSLGEPAAHAAQQFRLPFGLDAFRDNPDAETLRQINHGRNDGRDRHHRRDPPSGCCRQFGGRK